MCRQPAIEGGKLEPTGKHDACYLPRRIHITGDIDLHEMAYAKDGELWLVNTRFPGLLEWEDERLSHSSRATACWEEEESAMRGITLLPG